MNKERSKPIFYHPDECDCIACDARQQKGGLDHDPSNDDAKFEKHEESITESIKEYEGWETIESDLRKLSEEQTDVLAHKLSVNYDTARFIQDNIIAILKEKK